MDLVAVLLAAGGGSRFVSTSHKLLADLGGSPVYEHALRAVMDAGVGPVVVVTGAVEIDLPSGVRRVHNDRWADGQAGSLAAGIAAAGAERSVDAVMVGLADQPFVTADAWRAVASAPGRLPIAIASYDGRRGPNPVRLHRSVWPMLPVTGDEGARRLIRENPQLVCEVPCSGSAADIDTLEDLKRWTSS